jgi:putative membrane protein
MTMIRFLLRWAINAIALFVAIWFVQVTMPGGIRLDTGSWTAFIWMGLIFGLVNALVRPLLQLLTCPLIALTLGLFTLVVNTILFYLVGYIGRFFGVGFTVESFWAAFVGALVVSVVSILLTMVVKDNRRSRRSR